jgi:pyruvate formate lyase activating enzyme
MFATIGRTSACIDCNFCDYFVKCHGEQSCIGCSICLKGCPEKARLLYSSHDLKRPAAKVKIDGEHYSLPSHISIDKALSMIGKNKKPAHSCCSGGCYDCTVLVNDLVVSSCHTEITEGMNISTNKEAINLHPPLRLVSFFPGHLHAAVSLFTSGCNFNCDFCHNWNITFDSSGRPVTPEYAAMATKQMLGTKENPRIGISGGEPTLNRRWLVEYIKQLKASRTANRSDTRIQVDTNGSLLTQDYIDELTQAGMTDVSVDLKGMQLETFCKLTGVADSRLAQQYLDTAWQSIEYLLAKGLYTTIGLPYHPHFITKEELHLMGKKIAAIDKNVDVNLIVYQPAFRLRHSSPVADQDIDEAMALLNETGINRVWCQEGTDIPVATDPEELLFLGERF